MTIYYSEPFQNENFISLLLYIFPLSADKIKSNVAIGYNFANLDDVKSQNLIVKAVICQHHICLHMQA